MTKEVERSDRGSDDPRLKLERFNKLIEEAFEASATRDFWAPAQLREEICRLENQLELEADGLYEESRKASENEDYSKAAELRTEAEHLRSALRRRREKIRELRSEPSSPNEGFLPGEPTVGKLGEAQPEPLGKSVESEINFEMGRRNFVRAAMLAEQNRYPAEKVRYLQEQALKQYALEYRNAQGLKKLIQWYRLSKSEATGIISEGLSEWKGYGGLQWDINQMRHITLSEFTDDFLGHRL